MHGVVFQGLMFVYYQAAVIHSPSMASPSLNIPRSDNTSWEVGLRVWDVEALAEEWMRPVLHAFTEKLS